MKKRDRRQTPTSTSLAAGWTDAVPESTGTSEKVNDTASAFYLDGEGTSKKKDEEKDKSKEDKQKDISVSKSGKNDKYSNRIISCVNTKNTVPVYGPDGKRIRNTKESRAMRWIKQGKAIKGKTNNKVIKQEKEIFAIKLTDRPVGNIRVPVLSSYGKPLMPTKSSRARKWLRDGKAKVVKNDLGIFQIQLLSQPSGENKQDIVLTDDPGSRFTGLAVCSKKDVLFGCNLELVVDEKENRFALIKNRMDKRRELRRGRRHRNCRRREVRFLNRSKTGKMAPSIRSRKQLELRVIKELCKIYPIIIVGIEDVKFDHYNKKWGKNFSQVEVGKKWFYEELKNILDVKEIRLIKGYETNVRRKQLGLSKSDKKEERGVRAHVNDCIAMGSIILGLGIYAKTVLRQGINFNIVTRPKYSRRKLHNEKPSKGGIRRRFGGTTTGWTNIRKGDYVEAIIDKRDKDMMYRGWVGGYENDRKFISVYDFDWKVVGQFDSRKVRLLDRNHGLLVKSLDISKDRMEMCKFGTIQTDVEKAWR